MKKIYEKLKKKKNYYCRRFIKTIIEITQNIPMIRIGSYPGIPPVVAPAITYLLYATVL